MTWEVEQKFRVSDLNAARAAIEALGATFADCIEQRDRYFNHPERDFAKTDEAFRLRQVGQENWITYKGPRIDPHTKTRKELELPLPPGEATFEQYSQLFELLGFRPRPIVTKLRWIAELAWQGHAVTASLDHVQAVGTFVELEVLADDEQLSAAKSAVQSLASHLELGPSERRSYLELLLSGLA